MAHDRQERRKSHLELDTPFEPNAILRGAQLTFVGAQRALQNPGIFTSDHYKQAALAVAAGLLIRILVAIPTLSVRGILWVLGFVVDLQSANWDNDIIDGLEFIEHSVLQLPFFLMSLMRYITPTLDIMFMESLEWVDRTYVAKHKSEDPSGLRAMYYPNLALYRSHAPTDPANKKKPWDAVQAFAFRAGKRAGISLLVYLLSLLPVVGRFVLPAASFYTFRKAVGTPPAVAIFGTAVVLPKHYIVSFLQMYFSSRTLMRELLVPYFNRVPFTPAQKKRWFADRSGVLFGFAFTFVVLIKIPLVGVLVYGIAEASTAYLVTKITDPPPPPSDAATFVEGQVRWKNKHELLSVPLHALDTLNVKEKGDRKEGLGQQAYPTKKFS